MSQLIKHSKTVLLVSLVELYLHSTIQPDQSTKDKDLVTLRSLIFKINYGKEQVCGKDIDLTCDHIKQFSSQIMTNYKHYLSVSTANARHALLLRRRALFVRPILASLIPLLLISFGIVICLVNPSAIMSVATHLFIFGGTILIASQAYLWCNRSNPLDEDPVKSRKDQFIALSAELQDELFAQDTFEGFVFPHQLLDSVLIRQKNIQALQIQTPQTDTQNKRDLFFRPWSSLLGTSFTQAVVPAI